MSFSPDGRTLACGGHFHSVFLWDVASGHLMGAPLPQEGIITDIAFAPDGNRMAVATFAHQARLWDLTTRKLVYPAWPHPEIVARTQFSPDGRHLLTMCPSAAYLWDTQTGQRTAVMPYPTCPQNRLGELQGLFSPDGKKILLSSGYGSFRLWSAETGQALEAPTPLLAAEPAHFEFSPEGRLIVAGHKQGTAQLWDVATGRPVGAPVEQRRPVIGVGFHAKGQSFWTVANDGTVRTWPVPQPYEEDLGRLAKAVELQTGRRWTTRRWSRSTPRPGTTAGAWQEREGLAADWSLAMPADIADWHDARASDAEEAGALFSAAWHLDRLIAERSDDWLLYARRARTHVEANRWKEAEAYYQRAQRPQKGNALFEWYQLQAWVNLARGQNAAALWYLDRLLTDGPKDWTLYERRVAVLAAMGKAVEREADVEKAIELGADAVFLCRLACERAAQDRWPKAVALFARARRLGPLPQAHGHLNAVACLRANDTAGFRVICADMLRDAVQPVPGRYFSTFDVLQTTVLAPDAVEDYKIPLALAERLAGALGLDEQAPCRSGRQRSVRTPATLVSQPARCRSVPRRPLPGCDRSFDGRQHGPWRRRRARGLGLSCHGVSPAQPDSGCADLARSIAELSKRRRYRSELERCAARHIEPRGGGSGLSEIGEVKPKTGKLTWVERDRKNSLLFLDLLANLGGCLAR